MASTDVSQRSMGDKKTIFIVGLGMVGIAFIEKLMNLDEEQRYRIVTCGEEMHLAYNRVALTEYFQHRSVEKLYLNQEDWYAKQSPDRFLFHVGEAVSQLNTAEHTVTTSKDRTIHYDYCILATGSDATLPSYADPKMKGVFVYRNISDLNKLLDYSQQPHVKGGKAVVVGGGLLGLEAAKAVYDLEEIKDVAIVNRQAFPLSRQLDNHGGEIVLRRIEAMGVQVLTHSSPTGIVTAEGHPDVFKGLTMNDGSVLEADLVIFSVGISPRDDLAKKAGIACEEKGGITVNDLLETSAKDVYAIGECASWNHNTYGLIAPGVEMADILSFNFTQLQTEVGGFKPRQMNNPDLSTKLKLMGVDVASFGDFFAEKRHLDRKRTLTSTSTRVQRGSAANSLPLAHNQRSTNAPSAPVWEITNKPAVAESPSLTVTREKPSEDHPEHTSPSSDVTAKAPPPDAPPLPAPVDKQDAPAQAPLSSPELRRVVEESPLASAAPPAPSEPSPKEDGQKKDASAPRKRHGGAVAAADGPIETLTYRDPFSGVYKKYIFSADGKYLLGGMMVGDTSDYVKLVALVKKKKALDVPPSQFILGAGGKADDSGADLDDDTQVCSCHNVTKGQISKCVKDDGIDNITDLKTKTKAGTGCGGCMPLITNLFKAEMTKAGHSLNNNLCSHFAMSRAELFSVIQIKKLKNFTRIMEECGVKRDAVGCEVCKPTVGNILSSLWNEHVMNSVHHQNQDTNDRFMANIQRNGTFSVIPRVAGGEITPDKLIVLGQVAKKYNLYTKITGGQRVDLFGAQKADLPDIWEELTNAGFESGHAYGKSLRTVKSCVGTTWCRYGIGDSVGMAIKLEERYKGVRSPHKIKGGVSGCVRECAEAQSKDFGLIATDKGWNLYLAGNGGTIPRHAQLFATDVPPSKVIRIIDRFIMYYVRSADKLMRTARWVESFDGGIERLKKIIIDDELGICADLDKEMDDLVGTYYDEWKTVVEDPERRKQFRQFVNTNERRPQTEEIIERGQHRPADWAKAFPPVKMRTTEVKTPKDQWQWKKVCMVADLMPTDAGTTSAAIKYGDSQIAIFHVPKRGYFASQQMCPHKRAFVLDHGIIGDDPNTGATYVSCPMHKRNYELKTGDCLNDDEYSIIAFEVRADGDDILLLLPPEEELDAVMGTNKWLVRQATAEMIDRSSGGGVEIVGPDDENERGGAGGTQFGKAAKFEEPPCAGGKLEW